MKAGQLKQALKATTMPVLRSKGKVAWTLQLPPGARLLDVGCGNDSPSKTKSLRPDIHYIGLDVADYNQTDLSRSVADEYHLAEPHLFDKAIQDIGLRPVDGVLCSHNIEHTDKPYDVLKAVCHALKAGGQLYLAFPSERSTRLPSRKGTLNFYDDPTHSWLPPFNEIVSILRQCDVKTLHQIRYYRPLFYVLGGLVSEPYSALTRTTAPFDFTWALYGFESVIWGEKT